MNKSSANKIKPGTQFIKKDTGIIIEVLSKGKNDTYTTFRINRNQNRKGSHQIKKHDLLKFYTPLT